MQNWNQNQIDKYTALRQSLPSNADWNTIISACFSDAEIKKRAKEIEPLGTLPPQLFDLYKTIDQVTANHGCEYILKLEKLIRTNHEMRETAKSGLYMNFDSVLIFGETGNGDYLFCPMLDAEKGITKNDVFVWDHETDSRVWVASNIKDMFFRLSASMI